MFYSWKCWGGGALFSVEPPKKFQGVRVVALVVHFEGLGLRVWSLVRGEISIYSRVRGLSVVVAGFAKLAEPLVEVNERCLGVGLELDSYILFRPMPGVTRNCRWSTGFLPGRFFGFDCCSKQHALPAVSQ